MTPAASGRMPPADRGLRPARPVRPPADSYRAPGYASGQFPGPASTPARCRAAARRAGPLSSPTRAAPSSRPARSCSRARRTRPAAGRTDPGPGPARRTRAASRATGPSRPPAYQTGPHRPGPAVAARPAVPARPGSRGRADSIFTPARPMPSTPYDDDSLAGRDRFGSRPDPYDSHGSLPGLPPPPGPPAGRSGPFRWQPPAEPDGGHPDEDQHGGVAQRTIPRPRRPARPTSPRTRTDYGAGPDEVSLTGRLEADDEPHRTTPPPWEARDTRRSAARPAPGPEPDAEDVHPDWADDERHRGFFQGFGEDENVDPPKRRRGRWVAPLISLVVILGLIGTGGTIVVHVYSAAHANYTGAGTGQVDFVVKPGDNATKLAPRLVKRRGDQGTDPFVAAAKQSANAARLTPARSGCTSR